MAETTSTATPPLKRHREEDEEQEILVEEETKRQKPSSSSSSSSSYNQILCLLEDEPDYEPDQDLTPLMATLQQEISSDDQNAVFSSSDDINTGNAPHNKPMLCSSSSSSTSCSSKEEEEEDEGGDDKDRVMRHLLEASDDELGIPSTTDFGGSDYGLISDIANYDYANGGGGLLDGFGDALWELEDEAANYYTLLQSELFM